MIHDMRIVSLPGDVPTLPSKEQAHAAAAAFAMLADPTRLQILWLVSAEALDVTTLVSQVGAKQPAVSQHLAKLRLSGLVDMHRTRGQVFYRARDHAARALITAALLYADHHLGTVADHHQADDPAMLSGE